MPKKQDARLEEILDSLSKAAAATLLRFVDIDSSVVRQALMAMLEELGVDTAGIETKSDTATITIEDTASGQEATEEKE